MRFRLHLGRNEERDELDTGVEVAQHFAEKAKYIVDSQMPSDLFVESGISTGDGWSADWQLSFPDGNVNIDYQWKAKR